MNIATAKTGRYPPVSGVSTPAVWNRTDGDWWFAKISRIRAKITMPTISAATPMLLMIARRRMPKALMIVVVIRVTIAQKTRLLAMPIGLGSVSLNPKMLDMTSGTVPATAVTVTTPAQK